MAGHDGRPVAADRKSPRSGRGSRPTAVRLCECATTCVQLLRVSGVAVSVGVSPGLFPCGRFDQASVLACFFLELLPLP